MLALQAAAALTLLTLPDGATYAIEGGAAAKLDPKSEVHAALIEQGRAVTDASKLPAEDQLLARHLLGEKLPAEAEPPAEPQGQLALRFGLAEGLTVKRYEERNWGRLRRATVCEHEGQTLVVAAGSARLSGSRAVAEEKAKMAARTALASKMPKNPDGSTTLTRSSVVEASVDRWDKLHVLMSMPAPDGMEAKKACPFGVTVRVDWGLAPVSPEGGFLPQPPSWWYVHGYNHRYGPKEGDPGVFGWVDDLEGIRERAGAAFERAVAAELERGDHDAECLTAIPWTEAWAEAELTKVWVPALRAWRGRLELVDLEVLGAHPEACLQDKGHFAARDLAEHATSVGHAAVQELEIFPKIFGNLRGAFESEAERYQDKRVVFRGSVYGNRDERQLPSELDEARVVAALKAEFGEAILIDTNPEREQAPDEVYLSLRVERYGVKIGDDPAWSYKLAWELVEDGRLRSLRWKATAER